MKRIYNARGAVSIFLIIILLPSLTMAGLFLDMARTKLAHEVVMSSADLALNTVLSEYDQPLKDYFGLMASCQNTEEVIELSKRYFAESMVSAGVATSDAQDYADEVFNAFAGNSDIQDMLKIAPVGETSIEKVANGAMDNPAMLKTGIIEFMKYRAPVNAAADLFSKLTDSDVEVQIENASMETKMIEARDQFYTAERKLIEQAEKAYEAIKSYQTYETKTGDLISSENYIESMSSFLAAPEGEGKGSMEDIFKAAHTTLVMNLFNTHYTDGTMAVNLLKYQKISYQKKNTNYSDSTKASAQRIANAMTEMNTAYSTYCKRRSELDTAWSKIGSKKSSDWCIQYWVKLSETCKTAYTNYVKAAEALWKAANKVDNAVEFAQDDVMDDYVMKPPSSDYINYGKTDSDGRLTLKKIYDAMWKAYSNNYKNELESQTGSSSYSGINTALSSLDTDANRKLLKLGQLDPVFRIRNRISKYISDSGEGAKRAKKAAEETQKLLALIDNYRAAFKTWKTIAFDSQLDDSELATAKNASNPMAGGDRQQIQELEKNGLDFMSKNSVKDLRQRLTNIQVLWQTVEKDLKAVKYNRTSIQKLTDYPAFCAAAKLSKSRIVINESALRSYADESFSFTIGKPIQRIEIPKYASKSANLQDGDAYVITDSFYPDIEHTRLELYVWMKAKYDKKPSASEAVTEAQAGFNVDSKGSAKEADKTVTQKSKDDKTIDTSENLSGHNFSEWSGATLPSKGSFETPPTSFSAKISAISSYVSSIFADFGGTFKRSLVDARDDLYTISYIFDMFTYDTFDKEGCYNALSEADQKSKDPEKKYDSVRAKWEDSGMKTLTLTPRDTKNNWAYGGEVEYILYGGKTNSENKKAAYGRIYMVRYALDLSPVFQTYWNDKMLNSLAMALDAFAHIPTGVTKTAACLAITAAEAGADIKLLKKGVPVLLYKSKKSDLICSFKSVFNGAETSNGAKVDGRVALQYSDYLKIFLLMKLVGSDENIIYLRTGDVIQANMALCTGEQDFNLAKSQVYYTLQSTVRIAPMWSRFLGIEDMGDLSGSTGWRTTTVKITSGY